MNQWQPILTATLGLSTEFEAQAISNNPAAPMPPAVHIDTTT